MPSGLGIVLLYGGQLPAYDTILTATRSFHAFRRIPDRLRSPDHAGGSVFHHDKPLIPPVDEIRALPDEDAPRPGPLCRVPCCLLRRQVTGGKRQASPTQRSENQPTFPISRSVPIMYHFLPASSPPPGMMVGSRTPPVPIVGLKTGDPWFRGLKESGSLPLLR